jgi:type VI secretion system protein ImpL
MTQEKTTIRELTQQFVEAIQFIKKTKLKTNRSKKSLYESPWFILLGTEASGKTSLLEKSDIHFNLTPKLDPQSKQTTPNWWVNQNAILLDTPSIMLDKSRLQIWRSLVRLIKKFSYKRDIRALIVNLSIKNILDKKTSESIARGLAKHCNALLKASKQNPAIYITINQCDLIPGFSEYFSSLAKDERQQPWGFQLNTTAAGLTDEITTSFNELIRRLNQQLIWRLHHEPDNLKRLKIKDFPVQLAQTKQALLDFCLSFSKELKSKSPVIKGIYYTSADQPETTGHYESQRKNVSTLIKSQSKPYFIHDLFQKIIFETPAKVKKHHRRLTFKIMMGIIGLVVAGGIITAITMSFTKSNSQLENINSTLTKYQMLESNGSNSLQNQLLMLTELQKGSKLIKAQQARKQNKWLPGHESNKKLEKLITDTYYQSANKHIMPIIKASLERCLSMKGSLNPSSIYRCLSSYLMLAEPGEFKSAEFSNNLALIWQTQFQFNQKAFKGVLNHLSDDLAKQQQPALSPNYTLVTQAQESLKNLGTTNLGEVILLSQLKNNRTLTLNLENDTLASQVFNLKSEAVGIPYAYTANGYKELNENSLVKASNIALNGNWVIGNTKSNKESASALQNKILAKYFINYYSSWDQFINNVQFNQFQSVPQLQKALNQVTSNNSPLLQLLSLINANAVNSNSGVSFSSSLININTFINQKSNYSLSTLMSTLKQLSQYLNTIKTPEDALNLTKARMLNKGLNDPISQLLNLSKYLPAPLNQWMHQLAMNVWQVMLNTSKQALTQEWNKSIASVYQNQLNNRYPFNSQSNQDVSLNSFANMYAPTGLIQSYINTNLRPLIDTEKNQWQNASLDGLSLNFSNSTLIFLQNALKISTSLFPHHDKQMYLPITINATNFSNNLTSVNIQYGKHTFTFTKNINNNAIAVQWPMANTNPTIMIKLNESNHSSKELTYNGPWSLWRLMNSARLKPDVTHNHWLGIIEDQDTAFQFLMGSQKSVNPFSLNQFTQMHFPTNLFNNTNPIQPALTKQPMETTN